MNEIILMKNLGKFDSTLTKLTSLKLPQPKGMMTDRKLDPMD